MKSIKQFFICFCGLWCVIGIAILIAILCHAVESKAGVGAALVVFVTLISITMVAVSAFKKPIFQIFDWLDHQLSDYTRI